VVIGLRGSTALAFLAAVCTAVAMIRGMICVANTVILMEETDENPGLRGMGSAVVSMSRDVGSILGPLIGGLVAAAYGLDNMFRLVPVPLVALYIPLLLRELSLARTAAYAAGAPSTN